ncbi:hypothetical protein J3U57_12475 [Gilliamella sp. B3464]|uniref:DUF6896 domain-containing protein n=1 Tax=unclassified Gilliamella TaxID=2685620 RepID=UPI00226990C0|nr:MULTISPECIES: hypothetical protein [unclassified Gilliamella]MCX8713342.1 hypothetical protein [Gilliamella sp. B3468]MCX8728649.1 hypothetical protein [Gilliamella sp. B2838]MCX8752388.1 hypothetical protein [Gilliamella sp. B3464]
MFEKILEYINFQKKLMDEFKRLNSSSSDFKYFLDFPRRGHFRLNNEEWSFFRHGLGFRFTRQMPLPHLIIDPHVCPFEYKIVDDWRLLQFLESQSGNTYDKYDIKAQLEKLFLENKLERINSNQYKVIK